MIAQFLAISSPGVCAGFPRLKKERTLVDFITSWCLVRKLLRGVDFRREKAGKSKGRDRFGVFLGGGGS
jgi:hypothetical protein